MFPKKMLNNKKRMKEYWIAYYGNNYLGQAIQSELDLQVEINERNAREIERLRSIGYTITKEK